MRIRGTCTQRKNLAGRIAPGSQAPRHENPRPGFEGPRALRSYMTRRWTQGRSRFPAAPELLLATMTFKLNKKLPNAFRRAFDSRVTRWGNKPDSVNLPI